MATLLETDIAHLSENIAQQYAIPAQYFEDQSIKRGLRNADGTGVLIGVSKVGGVQGYYMMDGERVPMPGKLYYRGISVEDIVEAHRKSGTFGYEEVAYLLLLGSLPTQAQQQRFNDVMARARTMPAGFTEDMILKAPSRNIMNQLARSVLALYSYDDRADDTALDNVLRGIVRTVVIGIEGEDTAGQLVHDVAAGGLEDHVLGEPGGHGACAGHDVVESLLLRLRGQRAEQQQIRDLLIAERAAFPMGLDNILDADAAVIELAGHGNAFAVHHIIALHAADLADADEHARAVRVAQAALDALVFKILRGDGILLRNVFTQMSDVGFKKRCHGSGPPADLLPILYRSGSKNARVRFRLCRIFFEFLRIRKQCDELCNMNF